MWREDGVRYSANPLRELFDAAAQGYSIKLTCGGCRRCKTLSAHAVWHHFGKKGFSEYLRDVPKRFRCRVCGRRKPRMDLVHEEVDDTSLPMPSEQDWKRELRRRR
jgi:hypothetical protein